METINATRLFPSGAWELTGLHERRIFYGYTLREAKRAYRNEYRQARLGDRDAMFYTISGDLTPYAFACGYIQRFGEFMLYKDGCFHVQSPDGRIWETFATLTEARRAAKKLMKGNN
jgi:hypothetical protein